MSKKQKIDGIKGLFRRKKGFQMKIFLQRSPTEEPVFFKEIPHNGNTDIDIIAIDKMTAEALVNFMTNEQAG